MAYRDQVLPVSAGGTSVTSNTAYGIMTGGTSSTGDLQTVTLGASGTQLASAGAGAIPVFNAAPSYKLVKIDGQTVSNVTSFVFTSGITSTYKNYCLLYTRITRASGTTPLMIRISTDAGSTYKSTGYTTGNTGQNYNSTTLTNGNFTSGLMAQPQSASTNIGSGLIYIYNLTSGVGYVTSQGLVENGPVGTPTNTWCVGSYNTAAQTVNALQIVTQNGSVNFSGKFTLYGILES